jgi:hypothetical protein
LPSWPFGVKVPIDKTKPKAGQFLIQIGILVKTSGKTNRVLNFNPNTSVSNRLSSTEKVIYKWTKTRDFGRNTN